MSTALETDEESTGGVALAAPPAEAPAPVFFESSSDRTKPKRRGGAVVSGSLWTISGYATGQVLRFAGNIIVSRALLPECFGVMALVNVVLQALVMFSDVGLEPSVIQHRRGDEPAFRNTAWTIQVIRGWILFAVAVLLAWPVASFYAEPQLAVLLPVAGLSAVIAGFNSTALFTVRRHLQLGRLTILELVAQSTGLIVMCVWAWRAPTVWALLAGPLAGSLVTAVGSHWLIRDVGNRFHWEREAFHDLFHFGKWIFLGTLILFCAWQADRLLLGKLVSLEQLGIYSTGLAVATLPNLLLGVLAGAVLYPLLAKHGRNSSASMLEPLRTARAALLSIGWVLTLGVVAEGPRFFDLLYDERYAGAGAIAQWAAVAVWFMILSTTAERALPAVGDARGMVSFNLVKLLATVPLALVGFRLGGLPGFVLGLAAGAAFAHARLLQQLHRHGLPLVRQDACYTASLAAAALFVVLVGPAAGRAVPLGNELLTAVIVAAASLFAWTRLRNLPH